MSQGGADKEFGAVPGRVPGSVSGSHFKNDKVHRVNGVHVHALETGRNRLLVTGALLILAFMIIGIRLVELTILTEESEPRLAKSTAAPMSRSDIVDRNGYIIATSLPTVSLYADPRIMLNARENVREITDQLARILPDANPETIYKRLSSKAKFVWIERNLTPEQHFAVNRLGVPGLLFKAGERRVYPQGPLMAHILGMTDVDGRGVAGIEKFFDQSLRIGGSALKLSVDVRVQEILRTELKSALDEFKAIGAAGVVLDVQSGEIIAMSSLPDFDANRPKTSRGDAGFNRVTKGLYEMGSTFKLFTAAMALDTGTVNLQSRYDAREPIKISRFSIRDFHARNSWLSVPEIILYSSNIGAAKMAVDVGGKAQREYLKRFGQMQPVSVELPEIGRPLTPAIWRDINTMTVSYGHGIAVNPLQLVNGVAALVNGGRRLTPTLLRQEPPYQDGVRVISEQTSTSLRKLMRLVVSKGTGRNAGVDGYMVGGKTGTADKLSGRNYSKDAKISSFVGAFPMTNPRYVVFALLDEPIGNKRTNNYATGGWVAAPIVKKIIARMAPMLGMVPDFEAKMSLPVIKTNKPRKKKNKTIRQVQPPVGKPPAYKPSVTVTPYRAPVADEAEMLRRVKEALKVVKSEIQGDLEDAFSVVPETAGKREQEVASR